MFDGSILPSIDFRDTVTASNRHFVASCLPTNCSRGEREGKFARKTIQLQGHPVSLQLFWKTKRRLVVCKVIRYAYSYANERRNKLLVDILRIHWFLHTRSNLQNFLPNWNFKDKKWRRSEEYANFPFHKIITFIPFSERKKRRKIMRKTGKKRIFTLLYVTFTTSSPPLWRFQTFSSTSKRLHP